MEKNQGWCCTFCLSAYTYKINEGGEIPLHLKNLKLHRISGKESILRVITLNIIFIIQI